MAWVRLSDDFYDHPKFDKAGVLGIALFTAGLAWSNRNLTDGFIPRKTALRLLDFEDVVDAVRNVDRNGVTNGLPIGRESAPAFRPGVNRPPEPCTVVQYETTVRR